MPQVKEKQNIRTKNKKSERDKSLLWSALAPLLVDSRRLRALFSEVKESEKYAFVVVQHFAPSHKSRLVELIAHTAQIKVEEIANNTKIKSEQRFIFALPIKTSSPKTIIWS